MTTKDVSPMQRPHFYEALDMLNEIRRTGQPIPDEIPIESDDGVVVVVWKTDSLVEAEIEMDAEFLEALADHDEDECGRSKPNSLWDEDDVFGAELHRIARRCIEMNWCRTDHSDGGWHYFTKSELEEINSRTGNGFTYGYCFLDNDGGTEGMIRLVEGHNNPKWSFWLEGKSLMFDVA